MRKVGNRARHGKPLTIAVLVLFAFLNGYTAFHYHETPHCPGDCSMQQATHDTGEELAVSQADCNICFHAATPKIVQDIGQTGMASSAGIVASQPEESYPRYYEEYTTPLRGPPALSLSANHTTTRL